MSIHLGQWTIKRLNDSVNVEERDETEERKFAPSLSMTVRDQEIKRCVG